MAAGQVAWVEAETGERVVSLSRLWYSVDHVGRALELEGVVLGELELSGYSTTLQRQLGELRSGRQRWVSVALLDRLCCELGLILGLVELHMLIDPVEWHPPAGERGYGGCFGFQRELTDSAGAWHRPAFDSSGRAVL